VVASSKSETRSARAWALAGMAHPAAFLWAFRAGLEFGTPLPPEYLGISSSMGMAGLLTAVMLLVLAYERARGDALETLAALNRSLEEARLQADRANRAKTGFLASVSHELRTPMTAILGFADLLIDDWEHRSSLDEARQLITTVQRSGQQLLDLINDLLDLSNLESGRLGIESIVFAPLDVLGEVVAPMREAAIAKGLELELVVERPLPATMHGDAGRMAQVVLKLLENAVKFTNQGRIELRASACGQGADAQLVLVVSDTGPGIPREAFPSLFSSFHQVDASVTREHGGTGLGLALSQRLVTALGGTIAVESEIGLGSAFRVVLPAPEAVPGRTAGGTGAGPDRLDARVLLAEASQDSQNVICEILRRAGAEVDAVDDGAAALASVRAAVAADTPYDILILDMQMPLLDGAAATRALRAERHTLPILAITAEVSLEERERCLLAGCDDYATKPVERSVLIAVLQSLLREKSA